MAYTVQFRRGTSAEHSTFTGEAGEVTFDTTSKRLVVHDGTTVSGIAIAKLSDIPTDLAQLTDTTSLVTPAWQAKLTKTNKDYKTLYMPSVRNMSLNTDGTKVYVVDNRYVYEYDLSIENDLSTAVLQGSYYYYTPLTNDESHMVEISGNGAHLYLSSTSSGIIYQFDLETPYDISTISNPNKSINLISEENKTLSMEMNSSGTKMWTTGGTTDEVHQYTLSTPYDITTVVYDDVQFNLNTAAGITTAQSVVISTDGSKMYVFDSTFDELFEFDLSTAFDIGTATFNGISTWINGASHATMSPDGSKLYASEGSIVVQYSLTSNTDDIVAPTPSSTTWDLDISSLTFDAKTFSENSSRQVALSEDGTKMYVPTNRYIREYDLTIPYDISTASYVDQFYYYSAISNDETSFIDISSNGEHIYLTNDPHDQIEQLTMSTPYDITTAGTRKTINISHLETQTKGISFSPDGKKFIMVGINTDRVYEYVCTVPWDISTSYWTGARTYVGLQCTSPRSCSYSNDGTKMYVYQQNGSLFEYPLSTPFAVATANINNPAETTSFGRNLEYITISKNGKYIYGSNGTYVYQYKIDGTSSTAVTSTPSTTTWGFTETDFEFDLKTANISTVNNSKISADGTKWMALTNNRYVKEYTLSTPFDITTATLETTVDIYPKIGNQGTDGIDFTPDGMKFYIASHNDYVYQFELATPYDISSMTNSGNATGNFHVGSHITTARDLVLSYDGKKMFVMGSSSDKIVEYVLLTPFDVTTAYWTGNEIYVGTQEPNPYTLEISSDGLNMYMYGHTSRTSLRKYTMTTPYDLGTATYAGTITIPIILYPAFSHDGKYMYGRNEDNQAYINQYRVDGATATEVTSTPSTTTWDFTETDFEFDLKTANISTVNNSKISADGTKWIALTNNRYVKEFTLSTPFDITTATLETSVDIYPKIGNSGTDGIDFTPDGMKFYIAGHNDYVYQFELATPYDISSMVNSGNATGNFHVGSHITTARDLVLSYDGKKMFVMGSTSDKIVEYVLLTPFDVTTAYWAGIEMYIGTQDATPYTLEISSDGLNMYMYGHSSRTSLHKYTMTTPYALNTATYAGAITIPITLYPVFSHDGKYMYGRNESNTNYINQYRVDGATATEVTSTPSTTTWDFTETDFEFDLKTLNISSVNNSKFSADGTKWMALTNNRYVKEFTLSTPFDLTTATLETSVDIHGKIGNEGTGGIDFTPDGMKFYIAGYNDYVYQFEFTAPYDISSMANSGNATGYFHVGSHITTARDLVLSYDGKKMFVMGSDSDKIVEYVLVTPFDVTTAYWAGDEMYIGSQEPNPYTLEISSDGLSMYLFGHTSRTSLHKYTMTTPYALNTASYVGAITIPITLYPTFTHDGKYMYGRNESNTNYINQYRVDGATATEVTSTPSTTTWDFTETDFEFDLKTLNISSINNSKFSADGTKWIALRSNRHVYEYTLSTPFDITTATLETSVDFHAKIGNEGTSGIDFTPDGMKFYIAGYNDYVYQFELTTPYDISSITNSGNNTGYFHFGSHITDARDLVLSYDGKKIFVMGASSDKIVEYVLVTPFDVTTAYWAGIEMYIGSQEPNPYTLEISSDGLSMYLFGHTSRTSLHKYTMTTPYDLGTATYAGTITIPITLYPTFTHDGKYMYGRNESNSNYINQYRVDGTSSTAVTSTPSTTTWDFTETDFEFDLKTLNISSINNSKISADGTKWIALRSNRHVYEYTLSTPFDLTTATLETSVDFHAKIGNEGTSGIDFTPDGTKLYIAGYNDYVYQFELTTPYDLSSITNSGNNTGYFHVGSHITDARDLVLSYDGKKIFVMGASSDKIVEYILVTPFDVTTAYWAGDEMYIGSQEPNPYSLEISSDGLSMYLFGHTSRSTLHKYTMTTPYALNTASYVGAITIPITLYPVFSHDGKYMYGRNESNSNYINQYRVDGTSSTAVTSTPSTTTWDFTETNIPVYENQTLSLSVSGQNSRMSIDGTKFFIMTSNRHVKEYTLSTPFDISTATLETSVDFYVKIGNEGTDSMEINPDGTKLYIAGYNNYVYQFELATPYDLSSITNSGNATGLFHVGSHITTARDLVLSYDGKKMFVMGSDSDKIVEYVLVTPFDVTTAYWAGIQMNIGSQGADPYSLEISSDGLSMYMHDNQIRDRLHKYTMTTPYALNTASYVGIITIPQLLYPSFSHDGQYMYGRQYNNTTYIHQYKSGGYTTLSPNIDLYAAPWVSSKSVTFRSDDHNFYVNDAETLMITINDSILSSFTLDSDANLGKMQTNATFSPGAGVTSVVLSSTETEMYVLKSAAGTIEQYTLSSSGDISTASSTSTYTCPVGVIDFAMSSDGTRVYMMNSTEIQQFNLSTPWAITSSSLATNGTFDISNEITTPLSLQLISNAGIANSKFNVYGQSSTSRKELHQYAMGTPNDITTTSYNNDFAIDNSSDTNIRAFVSHAGDNVVFLASTGRHRTYYFDANDVPDLGNTGPAATPSFDITVSPIDMRKTERHAGELEGFVDDGNKLITVSGNRVYQYELATPYDITTATAESSNTRITNSNSTDIEHVKFSADGTKMYVKWGASNRYYALEEFTLSTPFDLTTRTSVFETGLNSWEYAVDGGKIIDIDLSYDGTLLYVLHNDDYIYQYGLNTPFSIDEKYWTGVKFDATVLDSTPSKLNISSDGTKIFVFGAGDDRIYQLDLTTPYDLSTAVNNGVKSVSIPAASMVVAHDGSRLVVWQSNVQYLYSLNGDLPDAVTPIAGPAWVPDITVSPIDMKKTREISMNSYNGLQGFVDDGSKLVTKSSSTVKVHNLSTPYDITTIISAVASSITTPNNSGVGFERVKFNSDGTKMYIRWENSSYYGNFSNRFQEFTLSTPWDVTTHSSVITISNSNQGIYTYIMDFDISHDGTRLYIMFDNKIIYEYVMKIPYSIGSIYWTGVTFDVTALDSTPSRMDITSDGTKILVYGTGNDRTYQLDLSTPFDLSTAVNNGVKSVSIPGAYTTAIAHDGSRLAVQMNNENRLVLYSLNGDLPVAVTPVAGASNFDVDITGTPINMKKTREISMNSYDGLQGFVDDGSKLVTKSSSTVKVHNLSTPYDITTIISAVASGIATPSNTGVGLERVKFNSDGTKMYIRWENSSYYGNYSNRLQEFTLSTPWDVTTHTNVITISSYYSGIYRYIMDFDISHDGTKLYIMYDNNIIYEYIMITPYGIGNIYWTGVTFDVTALDGAPSRMDISKDGTKMRIYGTGDDRTYQLDFVTPFDLSTVVNNGVKSVSIPDAYTTAIAHDGNRLVVQMNNENRLILYSLNGDLPEAVTPVAGASNFDVDITGTPINMKKTREISMNSYDGLQGFVDDGNKLVTKSSSTVKVHNLSTPYDITTIISAASSGIATPSNTGVGLERVKFNSDGTKMYIRWENSSYYGNYSNRLQEFTLSTPWDVTTHTSVITISSYYSGIYRYIMDFDISHDGTKLYIMFDNKIIYEYVIITPYSIGNIYWTGVTFDVTALDSTPSRMDISKDGTKMRIYGTGNDRTYQLDFVTPFDLSTVVNNGVKSVSIPDAYTTAIAHDGSRLVVQMNNENRLVLYSLNGDLPEAVTPVAGPAWTGDITESLTNTLASYTNSMSNYHGFVDDGSKLVTSSSSTVKVHNLSTPYDITTVISAASSGIATPSNTGVGFERVKFNSDGTKMYIRWENSSYYGNYSNRLQEFTLSTPWDVSTHTSVITISSYYSGIYRYIKDFDISHDGTKLYIMYDNKIIYEYIMITPYSIGNIYWTGVTFDVTALDSTPSIMNITSDGTKIFVYGAGNDRTYQLDLSTPFDLSTAVNNGVKSEQIAQSYEMFISDDGNFVSGRLYSDTIFTYKIDGTADVTYPTVTTPSGYISDWNFDFDYIIDQNKNHTSAGTYDHILFISNDGSKLYQSNGSTKIIYQYDLSIAYDVTSKSNNPVSTVTLNNLSNNVECMWISSDGVNMYIGDLSNRLYHYTLGTPSDLSTAVYTAVNTSVNTITHLRNIEFNPDGIGFNLYYETGQVVRQYICATPWDITTAYQTGAKHVFENQHTPISFQMSSNGTKAYTYTQEDDTLREYTLTTAWDISTISSLPSNSHYFINTDTIHIAANGSLLAASNGREYYVYSTDGTTYTPVTATGGSITWAADLQGLTNTDISYEPPASTDNFIFSEDGTYMYTGNGQYVTQHTLTTPYDISTASVTHTTHLRDDVGVYNAVTNQVRAMHINSTGTKFYVMDSWNNPKQLFQFDFGTPFQISTITATSGIYNRVIDSTITDFTMSYDGKKLFHTLGDRIVERVLATPFDITTEYETGNTYWLGDIDSSPKSLQFSSDGLALYIFGASSDSMYEFTMQTAYDISNITYSGITKRVRGVSDARLSSDGSKMYVRIGTTFYQYDNS